MFASQPTPMKLQVGGENYLTDMTDFALKVITTKHK